MASWAPLLHNGPAVTLPFTQTQFFDLFSSYNSTFWPVVVGLWAATLFGIVQLMRGRASQTFLGGLLVLHWGLSAFYHVAFFTRINPAAAAFAALFGVQVVAFAWCAFVGHQLQFTWGPSRRHALGAVFLVSSLLYPAFGLLAGDVWPRMPAFAVPCPTTLLTAGLLFAAAPSVPRWLFVIPILWSFIGGSAAIVLGVTPDLLLFAAGLGLMVYVISLRAAWWTRVAAVAAGVAAILCAAPARADQAPGAPTSASAPVVSWRVTGGYGVLSLRDIVRTGPPVDASPVAWRGTGVSLTAQRVHARGPKLHRLEVTTAFSQNFAYRSSLQSIALPAGDHDRTVEGRYEYRRYFFQDLGMRGLDLGGGIQAVGSWWTMTRHVPADLQETKTVVGTGPAFVVAGRLRRWSTVGVEMAWANGGILARTSSTHTAAIGGGRYWGGGWLSDLTLGLDVRLNPRASIGVRYVRTSNGLFSSHMGLATTRRAITAGVLYAK